MAERFSQQNQRVRPAPKKTRSSKGQRAFRTHSDSHCGQPCGQRCCSPAPQCRRGPQLRRDLPARQRASDGLPVDAKKVQDRQAVPPDLPRPPEHHISTRGVFPTSFVEENGELIADYGQRSIGRITSVGRQSLVASPLLDVRQSQRRRTIWIHPGVQRGVNSCWTSCFTPRLRAHRCFLCRIVRS